MNSQGILYIASGEKYIKAAIRSAHTVIKKCPDLQTHLFADWQNYEFKFSESPFPFTSVGRILNPHRRSKVDYLMQTPFDQTLYLDTDTSINADIREMFGILERFDIALTHAMKRNLDTRLKDWRVKLPDAFPQHNGGVILFRKNPEVIHFLEEWRDQYHENFKDFQQDQMTLRELLWLSDLRMAVLPPEYNVRYIKYYFMWSKSEAITKIFHLQRYHIGWSAWLMRPFTKLKREISRSFGRNRFSNIRRKKN